MRRFFHRRKTLLLIALISSSVGCTQLRGRRKLKEGNEDYKEGRYAEAVQAYQQAERLVPNLPVLWINKGTACRQILIPGSKTPENQAAADCALSAFDTLRRLRPDDSRGEQMYIQ